MERKVRSDRLDLWINKGSALSVVAGHPRVVVTLQREENVLSELYPRFILFSNHPSRIPPREDRSWRTSIGHLGAPFNPAGKEPPVARKQAEIPP